MSYVLAIDQGTTGSTALLISDQTLSTFGEYTVPPTIAPIRVPRIAVSDSNVTGVHINVDHHWHGQTETITDINRLYLDDGSLKVQVMGRGTAWLDTGTHESLLEAAQFVQIIEHRQGLKICCPEEVAYQNGWIDQSQVIRQAEALGKSGYGQYLRDMLEDTTY